MTGRSALGLAFAALAWSACVRSVEPAPERDAGACLPGRQLGCDCADGAQGVLRCDGAGRWLACVCVDSGAPQPDAGDADVADAAGCVVQSDADAGTVLVCGDERHAWQAALAERCTLEVLEGGTQLRCGEEGALLDSPVVDGGVEGRPLRTLVGTATIRNDLDAAFLALFERVTGDVVIEGTRLAALSLPLLRRVDGALTIQENPVLADVELAGLRRVGDALTVAANAQLTRLDAGELRSVTERLTLEANAVLSNVVLPSLAEVGSVFVEANDALHGLSLPALREVAWLQLRTPVDDFELSLRGAVEAGALQVGCARRVHLAPDAQVEGLYAECGVPHSLRVTGLRAAETLWMEQGELTSLSLPDLQTVGFLDLVLEQADAETFPMLREIARVDLGMDLPAVFDCAVWWPRLREVGEWTIGSDAVREVRCAGLERARSLSLSGAAALQSVDFSGLVSVEEWLGLSHVDALDVVDFSSLQQVGTLSVRNTDGPAALALPQLREAEQVTVSRNPFLTQLELPMLASAASVRIEFLPAQTLALPSLAEVEDLTILAMPELDSLSVPQLGILPELVHYGDALLTTAGQVEALAELPLRYVTGGLQIQDVAFDAWPFGELVYLPAPLVLSGAVGAATLSLDGFDGDVTVQGNPTLTRLALPELREGDLAVESSPALTELTADGWQTGSLTLRGNDSLPRFAFTALTRLERVTVQDNAVLRGFELPVRPSHTLAMCDNPALPACLVDAYARRLPYAARVACGGGNDGSSGCVDACCEGVAP